MNCVFFLLHVFYVCLPGENKDGAPVRWVLLPKQEAAWQTGEREGGGAAGVRPGAANTGELSTLQVFSFTCLSVSLFGSSLFLLFHCDCARCSHILQAVLLCSTMLEIWGIESNICKLNAAVSDRPRPPIRQWTDRSIWTRWFLRRHWPVFSRASCAASE